MRMVIRSIPAAALALCLGTAHLAAQAPGNGNLQWYLGGQGGVMFFKTPTQGRSGIPTFGGQTLIVAKRTGLMLSFEEGVGSNETSSSTSSPKSSMRIAVSSYEGWTSTMSPRTRNTPRANS